MGEWDRGGRILRLATLKQGGRDGTLAVISSDGSRYALAGPIAATLQDAIDSWSACEPKLRELADRIDAGAGEPLDGVPFAAPLPRAWQWLDGSAFPSHGDLMDKV